MKNFRLNLFPHFYINLLFFPILAASIAGNYYMQFFLSYFCAVIHELAHVFTAHMLGIPVAEIEIQPFGVCCRLKSEIIQSPAKEIIIALAGPVSNLLIIPVVLMLSDKFGDLLCYFVTCNIAIAMINLVPALPLDGGRILRAILTLSLGSLRAYNTSVKFSKIPIILLLCAAVYGLLSSNFNFSLILIGAFLLGNLFKEQRNISLRTLREILASDSKLSEAKHSTVITAHSSDSASQILKLLSYNKYCIVHVTDDNKNVIKTLTEGKILNALVDKGIRTTLGDI